MFMLKWKGAEEEIAHQQELYAEASADEFEERAKSIAGGCQRYFPACRQTYPPPTRTFASWLS